MLNRRVRIDTFYLGFRKYQEKSPGCRIRPDFAALPSSSADSLWRPGPALPLRSGHRQPVQVDIGRHQRIHATDRPMRPMRADLVVAFPRYASRERRASAGPRTGSSTPPLLSGCNKTAQTSLVSWESDTGVTINGKLLYHL